MSSSRNLRRYGLSIVGLAALFGCCSSPAIAAEQTAFDAATLDFDDLKRPWDSFAAAGDANRSSADAATPKLVDLTKLGETDALADDADYFDTALVARNGRLFGLFARSDRDFYYFVSPQSNPLLFEDPRTLTEVRMHFVNQWIPDANPVFLGGSAQYVAAQARVALTRRLSIIANKDGYLWLQPNNPALGDPEGFADLAAGLKYNLIRNPERQFLFSVGFTHEFASGANRVFQGQGNGEWHLFMSSGMELFGVCHWTSGGGIRIPNDHAARSSLNYMSQAFDVMLTRRMYLLTQLNWFHWYTNGANAIPFEGNDLFNLGSNAVKDTNIVTASWGGRYKFGSYHEAGIAYEIPLTDRRDLLESRLYLDMILRY